MPTFAATNRTLLLTGSSTGAITMFSDLSNSGAGGALANTKEATGSWALAGNQTHSGATIVSAGRLHFIGG